MRVIFKEFNDEDVEIQFEETFRINIGDRNYAIDAIKELNRCGYEDSITIEYEKL